MSKIIRVSDEAYEWIKARAQQDNVSISELVDAFSPEDWQLLDKMIEYAKSINAIPEATLASWIRCSSNYFAGMLKTLALKRRGFE